VVNWQQLNFQFTDSTVRGSHLSAEVTRRIVSAIPFHVLFVSRRHQLKTKKCETNKKYNTDGSWEISRQCANKRNYLTSLSLKSGCVLVLPENLAKIMFSTITRADAERTFILIKTWLLPFTMYAWIPVLEYLCIGLILKSTCSLINEFLKINCIIDYAVFPFPRHYILFDAWVIIIIIIIAPLNILSEDEWGDL